MNQQEEDKMNCILPVVIMLAAFYYIFLLVFICDSNKWYTKRRSMLIDLFPFAAIFRGLYLLSIAIVVGVRRTYRELE